MTAVGSSDFSRWLTALSENSCPRRDAGISRFRFGVRAAGANTSPPCATPPSGGDQPAQAGGQRHAAKNDKIVAPDRQQLVGTGGGGVQFVPQQAAPVRGEGGQLPGQQHHRRHGSERRRPDRGCGRSVPARALFAAAAVWLFRFCSGLPFRIRGYFSAPGATSVLPTRSTRQNAAKNFAASTPRPRSASPGPAGS